MANLILWRHAEAEVESDSGIDSDRKLTKNGRKDAKKMAEWLNQNLPKNTEILSSPAKRCLETVAELQHSNQSKIKREVKIADFLRVDSSVDEIAKQVSNDDTSQTILIVGHQPNLGLLLAKLLGMKEGALIVKKGAVWWLRQRYLPNFDGGVTQTYLYTVQHPNL
jgi:phosphohistidine phosphatase